MTWIPHGKHLWALSRQNWHGDLAARVELRLGKWTLEMYRPSETSPNLPWEFVMRFDDLEEAKRVGFTLARIEENT